MRSKFSRFDIDSRSRIPKIRLCDSRPDSIGRGDGCHLAPDFPVRHGSMRRRSSRLLGSGSASRRTSFPRRPRPTRPAPRGRRGRGLSGVRLAGQARKCPRPLPDGRFRSPHRFRGFGRPGPRKSRRRRKGKLGYLSYRADRKAIAQGRSEAWKNDEGGRVLSRRRFLHSLQSLSGVREGGWPMPRHGVRICVRLFTRE